MQSDTACRGWWLDGQPEGFQWAAAWCVSWQEAHSDWPRRDWGFRASADWLVSRLKELETDSSPFSGPIPRKPGRVIHYAKPELVADFEMTSWTNDVVIRQASLQEVRERKDKNFRPDGSTCLMNSAPSPAIPL